LNPGFIKARLLMADLYLQERDFAQAQKESEDVLAIQPTSIQAMVLKGAALMYLKKTAEAQKVFEEVIKISPENPVGYYRLGLVKQQQGQNDLAMQNFKKALDINPNLMDVFSSVVFLLSGQKDLSGALNACDRQLEKVGDNKTARAAIFNLKGGVYLALKKNQEAENSFKQAIAENPDFLQSYFNLAKIYLSEKRFDEAISQYQTALENNPDQAGPHVLLGAIYDFQKKTDLSEKHYRAALKIYPDSADAANNLAFILAERGENLNEALELAQKARSKFPENPNIIDTLGWVYYKKGLYDNAISEFSDAVEKLPQNPVVRYHLGLAYYKKGDNDKAKKEFEKALSLNSSFDGAEEAKKILAEM